MAVNYFAPAFKVQINGSGVAADVSKNIQRVTIIRLADMMDTAQLILINPYPEMRWTHNESDRKLFAIGNTIAIEMGYVGNTKELFFGDVTSVSASFSESGTPTVEVSALTRLHRLNRIRRTRPSFRGRTDKEIVEEVARPYGLTVDAEDTQVPHPSVTQENQTDLEFLADRATKTQFTLRVEGKTLIFHPAEPDQPPLAVVEWGKHLRNFTPRMNAAGAVSRVIVRGSHDPKTKKPIVGRYPSGPPEPKSGPQVAEAAFGPGEDVVVAAVSSQKEADQRAQAAYENKMRQFLTATAGTVGMPELVPGKIVEIKNVGLFSGKYRLTQVTHELGISGYTTHFDGQWVKS